MIPPTTTRTRDVTRSSPSSTRSAGASPATAAADAGASSAAPSPLERPSRSRRARRCSTGPSRRNGTSATPTSRTRPAGGSSTSARSNLHVVNYSMPVRARLSLAELRPHLHTLPDQPGPGSRIAPPTTPRRWGFCLSQRQLDALPDGDYDVCIDSTLAPGTSPTASCVLPGETDGRDPDLHPRLPPLAGRRQPVAASRSRRCWPGALARRAGRGTRCRFLYAPGTIGAITWLARNRERAEPIKHGLTLDLPRRRPPVHLQAEPSRRRRHRPRGRARPRDRRPRPPDHRLLPLRLRRTAVRLPRVPPRPSARLMRGRTGNFPSTTRRATTSRFVSPDRLAESLARPRRGSRRARRQPPLPQPRARTASRSSAAAVSTAPWAAPTSPTCSSRCSGC